MMVPTAQLSAYMYVGQTQLRKGVLERLCLPGKTGQLASLQVQAYFVIYLFNDLEADSHVLQKRRDHTSSICDCAICQVQQSP